MERAWLQRDTVEVARELIGCQLVRTMPDGCIIRVEITETEAYKGHEDPASHAFKGRTPRNEVMFGEAGRLYVYFIYGMHYCLNIVAHPPGDVGAVLLRGCRAIEGLERIRANRSGVHVQQLLNGPGKLAQALGMDKRFNGYDICRRENLEARLVPVDARPAIECTPRIGITKGTELLWRFVARR